MSDDKLLELAAKAAGYNVRHLRGALGYFMSVDGFSRWDPISDDGDALRLAVKLGIRIMHPLLESIDGYPNAVRAGTFEYGEFEEVYEDNEGDAMKSTRLAIVKASAAIGRSMP